MSGVVAFPDGTQWFVNGWGWRTLMERAVASAQDEPEATKFLESLHSQGLIFELLDKDFARRTAKSLSEVAVSLRREFETGSDYEVEYAARLEELLAGLNKLAGSSDREST